ncbi:MAG: ABC transporter ATP-binding protein [Actinomycetota bacterium]
MRGITKRFSRVVANDAIDFDARDGEIHGLLGENGAGKTTLMNILSGFLHADRGTIDIKGKRAGIRIPLDAFAHGIGMVHQQSALVPTLTVAENMLLGERGFRLSRASIEKTSKEIAALAERHGLAVNPAAFVWQLSVGERQRAEILRALHRDARVLILDEPTASLTPTEVEPLLEKLRTMAAGGATVILITHHLDEVMSCADRITVLRGGKRVATLSSADTNTRELARLMVGRDVALQSVLTNPEESLAADEQSSPEPGATEPVLQVRNLTAEGARGVPALYDESFTVRRGEIVAVAGVEGNGQAELEEVLFGLRVPEAGRIVVGGEDVTGREPEELLRRGVGFIPSDRYRRGLVRSLSIANNLVLDRIDRRPYGTRLVLHPKAILADALDLIQRFSIHAASAGQPAGSLSGGNAQRVVLARALSSDLRVLIAAQPTRGLDVGATGFVWEQLRAQRENGVGIFLISTDLDEVFALADACYVMYRGRLVGPWARDDFDREEFGLAMGGAWVDRTGGLIGNPRGPAMDEEP